MAAPTGKRINLGLLRYLATGPGCLLLAEGLAVGALVHGGVGLMGAHQDAVQRAVVLVLAVISALLDGAFDTLVGMTVHGFLSSFF